VFKTQGNFDKDKENSRSHKQRNLAGFRHNRDKCMDKVKSRDFVIKTMPIAVHLETNYQSLISKKGMLLGVFSVIYRIKLLYIPYPSFACTYKSCEICSVKYIFVMCMMWYYMHQDINVVLFRIWMNLP
jgi:hypothetical protein